MNEDKNNKIKTSLVIVIFIIIILLSAYVVIDKVISNEKSINFDKIKINTSDNYNNDTTNYLEINNYDDTFYRLNNYIDDISLNELYKYKNKELDFNIKSYITTRNINDSDKIIEEISYIDKEIFEKKYIEIFGSLDTSKTTNMCGASNYDDDSNSYIINSNCSDNNPLFLSFFKNVTSDSKDKNLTINKYYVFVSKSSLGYILYKDENFKNIIVENIKYENIKDYIYKMNTISINLKKDESGNYYVDSIK